MQYTNYQKILFKFPANLYKHNYFIFIMKDNIDEKELNFSLKLLVRSSMLVFVGIILSKIFAYLFRIIIARQFGPEIYGLFSLASMILLLFYSFFSFGLINGIVRFFSIYRATGEINKIRSLLKTSTNILVFSSIIGGLILFFTAEIISVNVFHNSDLIIYLKFFSLILPFYIFYSVFMAVLQSYEEIGWYSFIDNILQNAIRLILLTILVIIGFKTSSIIISYTFSIFFIFLLAFCVCEYKLPKVFEKSKMDKTIKKKITKELFSYSWPLTFFVLVSYFFYWIDSLVIGYFMDASQVGFYNAAVPIAALLIFVPNLFIQLFFPLITKEFGNKNFMLIKELSKQITKWIFILNLPLFAIMIFFPGAFLNILFGSKYIVAENSLIFLAIGSFFYSIFYLSNNLVSIIGKSKLILINIIFVSLFNLILASILVQNYGIDGVAFATMISNIILTLLFVFEVKYYTTIIPLRRKIWTILFSAAMSSIILIYVKQFFLINLFTIIIQLILFTSIYSLIILLTKSLDKNDLMILRLVFNKINLKKI